MLAVLAVAGMDGGCAAGTDRRRRRREREVLAVLAVAGMDDGCSRHRSVTAAPGESDEC